MLSNSQSLFATHQGYRSSSVKMPESRSSQRLLGLNRNLNDMSVIRSFSLHAGRWLVLA